MNTFLNGLSNETNFKKTENGAIAHLTTRSHLLDMYAFGSAYRTRNDDDCITLFKAAYEENPTLALKLLFYIRDAINGTGERRFFRVCFHWLANAYPDVARKNMKYITYKGIGRWDDFYCLIDTPLENDMFSYLKEISKKAISYLNMLETMNSVNIDDPYNKPLIFKWLKSMNSSNMNTNLLGKKTCEAFNMTPKNYRKMLSYERKRIRVLERIMSDKDWDEIEFDKIPSKAGLKYKSSFIRNPALKDKYKEFVNSKDTKVNTKTLFPYEIVADVINHIDWWYGNSSLKIDPTDRAMLNKMWDNLPDVFEGKSSNMICVCDTSGSMHGTPINVAISLSLYCAQRLNGPFKNTYISFSSRPQLIDTSYGVDFCDIVKRIYKTNLCDNTNLQAVFSLLLKIADDPNTKEEDIPDTICVISDMEIDRMTVSDRLHDSWTESNAPIMMEDIRRIWKSHGHKMPRLVYWNVNTRHNTILDLDDTVSFVSGASQNTFKAVLTGKNGYDILLDILDNDRYKFIEA